MHSRYSDGHGAAAAPEVSWIHVFHSVTFDSLVRQAVLLQFHHQHMAGYAVGSSSLLLSALVLSLGC